MSPETAVCINQGSQEGHNCAVDNVHLPNVNNCSTYYKCINGKVKLEICSSGYLYDSWLQKCVSASLASCHTYSTIPPPTTLLSNSTIDTPTPGVNNCPNAGALLPNIMNCSTYYECVNDTPILQECPPGLSYSSWDQICEDTCITVGSQIGKTCSIPGLELPNPNDCGSYYQCSDGTVVSKKCGTKTFYSAWYKECVAYSSAYCIPIKRPQI